MKLLSARQIQEWDAYTIAQKGIRSVDLMETASEAFVTALTADFPDPRSVFIFCGKGNNGGDGLAIARLLAAEGWIPRVYILEFGAPGTPDFQTNLQRLHGVTNHIHFIQDSRFFPELPPKCLVVDALYGSGLNRPLEGLPRQLVEHINNAAATVVSVDIPSGMYIQASSKGNTIVQAAYTYTFQAWKLCLLLAENAAYTGEVRVLDIGLDSGFAAAAACNWQITLPENAAALYQPRKAFSHKGSFGHALLVAGSEGKTGAAVLAARACLRSGVGLLTVHVPQSGYTILQSSVPEAMSITSLQQQDVQRYAVWGIGPGMGTEATAVQLLDSLLTWAEARPLVLDADALNILSSHPEWLKRVPEGSVLTPHPKEFDRLFGAHTNEMERLEKALAVSAELPLAVIVKGHHTLVAWQGRGYFNTTGNAGMATGGSGDVLTGLITGLLAQYKNGFTAAVLGVFLHGLAADLALEKQSMESLLPGDITDTLGAAFRQLMLLHKKEA